MIDFSKLKLPLGTVLRIRRPDAIHPSRAGFRRSLGMPRGQIADWRKTTGHGCIHVREYRTWYAVHRDRVDPKVSVFGHLFKDVLGL